MVVRFLIAGSVKRGFIQRKVRAPEAAIVGPNGMVSWDRGYNDAGQQVWGAEKGGYEFVKRPKQRPDRVAEDQ
jgi:hypothetical protein